jgi:hypothetical protein
MLRRIARIGLRLLLSVIVVQAVPTHAIAQKDPAPPVDQSAERDQLAKINKAVDTLNFASSWIDGSFSRYDDQVDLVRGPTGHESPISGRRILTSISGNPRNSSSRRSTCNGRFAITKRSVNSNSNSAADARAISSGASTTSSLKPTH